MNYLLTLFLAFAQPQQPTPPAPIQTLTAMAATPTRTPTPIQIATATPIQIATATPTPTGGGGGNNQAGLDSLELGAILGAVFILSMFKDDALILVMMIVYLRYGMDSLVPTMIGSILIGAFRKFYFAALQSGREEK